MFLRAPDIIRTGERKLHVTLEPDANQPSAVITTQRGARWGNYIEYAKLLVLMLDDGNTDPLGEVLVHTALAPPKRRRNNDETSSVPVKDSADDRKPPAIDNRILKQENNFAQISKQDDFGSGGASMLPICILTYRCRMSGPIK